MKPARRCCRAAWSGGLTACDSTDCNHGPCQCAAYSIGAASLQDSHMPNHRVRLAVWRTEIRIDRTLRSRCSKSERRPSSMLESGAGCAAVMGTWISQLRHLYASCWPFTRPHALACGLQQPWQCASRVPAKHCLALVRERQSSLLERLDTRRDKSPGDPRGVAQGPGLVSARDKARTARSLPKRESDAQLGLVPGRDANGF
jgi:hypothetical protein